MSDGLREPDCPAAPRRGASLDGNASLFPKGCDKFLREERVAAASVEKQLREIGFNGVRTRCACSEHTNVLFRQPAQRQFLEMARSSQLVQGPFQRPAAGEVLGSIRSEEQDTLLGGIATYVLQELEARLLVPLHVLDSTHQNKIFSFI